MGEAGNASSIHGAGRNARKLVEDAREEVAKLAGVKAAQVIFNSGATEGNNTILSGYQDKRIFISAIEHPSVLEAAPHAQKIPVTKNGIIDVDAFQKMLEDEPALVCVQLVNSETGARQPVADIAHLAKNAGALVLCDAVQAAGRMEIDFKELGVDYLTLSAHKFGGPQGTGALIFREGLQIPKFLRGGGQEKRQRPGTENVACIAGFGVAAKLAHDDMTTYQTQTRAFQTKLESALRSVAKDIIIVAENVARVSNTTNIILADVSAETGVMAMDLEGIAVSSGSACSSGTFKPSHVLNAMGYSEKQAGCALRFSTGWATTSADIDETLVAFTRITARLKK